MATETETSIFKCENASDGSSTVQTDDSEFAEFISSQWKDSVEVGLVIEYPLPHTKYLDANSYTSNHNSATDEIDTRGGAAKLTKPMVGKSIVVQSGDDENEKDPVANLPPLKLSTVLQEGSIAPLFDGTQWAGTRVWKAAVLGLEYLLRERKNGKAYGSLLELGCGLGVPGMVWKQILSAEVKEEQGQLQQRQQESNSARVLLTDLDSLSSQLKANVKANFPDDPSIEATILDWSREGIRSLLQTEREKRHGSEPNKGASDPVFDVCLNCDCVFEPLYGREAWESLADVLSEVGQLSPSTLLVTALERRNGDNVEGFLAKLEKSGTLQVPIQKVVKDETDPHHVIEIYVTKGLVSERSELK